MSGNLKEIKSVIVLSRADHEEAMRVAAGLTIFGHSVRLVFMNRSLSEAEAEGDNAELLMLCDIEPETSVAAMAGDLNWLDDKALGAAIIGADVVVNI